MAPLDHEVTVRVRVVSVSRAVFWLALAAVMIAGMHYGYQCTGCP